MPNDGEHRNMSEDLRGPPLLVIKGSFAQFGGAERDVVRQLEAWSRVFDEVRIATLHSHPELDAEANRLGIPLFTPASPWKEGSSALDRITASSSRAASKSWRRFLTNGGKTGAFAKALSGIKAIHLISGAGSLEVVDILPIGMPVHVHMLEPNRGLHGETALWARIDGSQPRPIALTRLLLTIPRRRDKRLVNRLAGRNRCRFSGNSPYIQSRIKEVFDIDAGVFLPCVDTVLWSAKKDVKVTDSLHVVTIGRASWVKGTWECIDMLAGSKLKLVLVGGGDPSDIEKLKEHAEKNQVVLEVAPRLEHTELVELMASARAVISLAHGEPFGLTPVEAHAVGTPALMIDEGGFRTTVEDGVSGRLLPRDDKNAWTQAFDEAANPEIRSKWSIAGKKKIEELGLDSDSRARDLLSIIQSQINQNQIS